MNDLSMRMFLRTTVLFKDIGVFKGKDKSLIYSDSYSGNHVVIFECELKAPPQISLIDHTLKQFIDGYRMNFRNWKIADIDNFMGGNPFFADITNQKLWQTKIETTIGTKGEVPYFKGSPDWDFNSPNYGSQQLSPYLEEIVLNEIEVLDTRSNRNMSPLHK